MDDKLARIAAKRAQSAPLPHIDAPYVCSDYYKIGLSCGKTTAQKWDHHFSVESRQLVPSPLKVASRDDRHDEGQLTTFLAAARPQAQFFPWASITMNTPWTPEAAAVEDVSCIRDETGYDFSIAMNYGYTAGSPQCLRWITEHVEMLHNPPYADWDCSMTCATTQALDVAFRMFCNRGDWVLMESHSFSGTIAAARLQGLRLAAVAYDEDGMSPSHLRTILELWDASKGKKPTVLYTVPCGQNPTGTTQSPARRKEIYQVAEEHDLYILEDDPYYYLSLGNLAKDDTTPETPETYLARLSPSYLSLDVSGRVMRMDSASKILAPGLRIGWITASKQVVSKFLIHTEVGSMAPSGPSQIMMYKLVDETWGHKGFFQWLAHLSGQYRRRRDIMIAACFAYLDRDTCQWVIPMNGLFMWLQIPLQSHPLAGVSMSESEIEDRIYQRALRHRVSVAKGSWFAIGESTGAVYFRLSWAPSGEEELRGAIERVSTAIQEEFASFE